MNTTATIHQPPPPTCNHCKSDNQIILHNIILTPKSPPIRLCTSCVLLHYRKSICSQCFEPYDAVSFIPPPLSTAAITTGNNRLLPCMRCDSWSHNSCPPPNVPKSPYICPPCMSIGYKYFDCRRRCEAERKGITKDEAKQLLGAARIAAVTIEKAAAVARFEADRRVEAAALARKRAREAIDRVVATAAKVNAAAVVLGTGPTGVNYTPVRLESNGRGNVADVEVKNGNKAVVTPRLQDDKIGVVNGATGGNAGQGQPVAK